MDDILADMGLRFAETLPLYLGLNLAVLVLLGWGAYKAHENHSPGGIWLCAIAAVPCLAIMPVAYAQARDYCTDLAATSRSASTTSSLSLPAGNPSPIFPRSPGIQYALSKCVSVWPYGPDAS